MGFIAGATVNIVDVNSFLIFVLLVSSITLMVFLIRFVIKLTKQLEIFLNTSNLIADNSLKKLEKLDGIFDVVDDVTTKYNKTNKALGNFLVNMFSLINKKSKKNKKKLEKEM